MCLLIKMRLWFRFTWIHKLFTSSHLGSFYWKVTAYPSLAKSFTATSVSTPPATNFPFPDTLILGSRSDPGLLCVEKICDRDYVAEVRFRMSRRWDMNVIIANEQHIRKYAYLYGFASKWCPGFDNFVDVLCLRVRHAKLLSAFPSHLKSWFRHRTDSCGSTKGLCFVTKTTTQT